MSGSKLAEWCFGTLVTLFFLALIGIPMFWVIRAEWRWLLG